VPVVLANLAQTLMGLVDTLMVGRLGSAPLAAVGVATLLFAVVAMSVKALDTAAQTFTAQRVGAGRDGEVGAVLATALSASITVGILLTVLMTARPDLLMNLVSDDQTVQTLGARYLVYRYAGLVPALIFFMLRGVFDGIGWTRIGMIVGIGMNLVNVLLNWLLIFGVWGLPSMGVAGAALASTISAALAALVCIAIALHTPIRRRFRFFARGNLQPRLLGPFLRIGWPPTVQSAGVILAMLVFFFILGRISTLAVAAGNVVLRIASLSLMPGIGIGVAVQTLVGQALGAGRSHEVGRIGWSGVLVAVILLGGAGLVFALAPRFLLGLFATDPELIELGVPILRLTGWMQVAAALGAPLAGALRGAGETRLVMLVDAVAGFGLVPGGAWLFGLVLDGGLLGSWLALVLWFNLYALGMVGLFLRGVWRRAEVST